jgi:hypothetical protein
MVDSFPSNHQHSFFLYIAQIQTQQQYTHLSSGLLEEKKVIHVTLDMSAAFEHLNKSMLVPKLRAHGFSERVIENCIDFLSEKSSYSSERVKLLDI